MLKLESPALARLEADEVSLGVGIRHARVVDIAPIMKNCGFDWLFLDLEHSAMPLDTAAQISMAALDTGITPIGEAYLSQKPRRRLKVGLKYLPHCFSIGDYVLFGFAHPHPVSVCQITT